MLPQVSFFPGSLGVPMGALVDVQEFRVDVAHFTLAGLSPLTQDRTCISGETCILDGFLEPVPIGFVLALDTCGGAITTQTKSGALVYLGLGILPRVSWGSHPQTVEGDQHR